MARHKKRRRSRTHKRNTPEHHGTTQEKPSQAPQEKPSRPPQEKPSQAPQEPLAIEIDDLSSQGDGVGRSDDGYVFFVPYTAPGDRVLLVPKRRKKRYAHATLHRILEPSAQREEPPCALFGRCGGCQWQHLSYELQASSKQNILTQAMQRVGGFTLTQPPVWHPAGEAYGTRTRVRLQCDPQGQLAFFARGSHQPIPVSDCVTLAPSLRDAIRALRPEVPRFPFPVTTLRLLTSLQGSLALALELQGPKSAAHKIDAWFEDLQSLLPSMRGLVCHDKEHNTLHQVGMPWIDEGEPAVRYRPQGFAQASFACNQTLVQTALSIALPSKPARILEIYAGSGNFSLPFAQAGCDVIALESVPQAVEDGNTMAKRLKGPGTARFHIFHDGRDALRDFWPSSWSHPDLVLLDPPRRGVPPALIEELIALQPTQILYVSCDPATLARDLRLLHNANYQLDSLHAVDLMPQTAHLESIALLRCQGS